MKRILSIALIFIFVRAFSCTIFSSIDKNGHVWTGNNEDYLFTFNTFVKVFARTDTTFGFICFANSSLPEEYIQGGINEAGLFYDGNSVPPSIYKDYEKKKDFPGGERKMIEYMLKKCATVEQVFQLFSTYRLNGNETGQIHLADKNGTFGIITADSMWITKNNFQISTNFNLCHSNHDNITCWRYPIVEQALKNKEVNLNTFKEICNQTSQQKGASTIYSNIQDLTTGEIWLFYGMDYAKSVHLEIKNLINKKDSSFYMRDLFKENSLVKAYIEYLKNGQVAALDLIKSSNINTSDQKKIIRLLIYDICFFNINLADSSLTYSLLKDQYETDGIIYVIDAIITFSKGNYELANKNLKNYIDKHPDAVFARTVFAQMNGKFDRKSNVKFKIKGFENAKSVFVKGLSDQNIKYFLIKKGKCWVGNFILPPDNYMYTLVVNNEEMLDMSKDMTTFQGKQYNRLIVK